MVGGGSATVPCAGAEFNSVPTTFAKCSKFRLAGAEFNSVPATFANSPKFRLAGAEFNSVPAFIFSKSFCTRIYFSKSFSARIYFSMFNLAPASGR